MKTRGTAVAVVQALKQPVLGMRERDGHAVAMPVPSTSKELLQSTDQPTRAARSNNL